MNRPLLSILLATLLTSTFVTGVSANPAAELTIPDTVPPPSSVDSTNAQRTSITLAQLGRAAFKEGNYPLAIEYYTAALDAYPLLDAFLGRNIVYSAMHEREKSADDAIAAATIIKNTGTRYKFATDLYHLAGLGYKLSEKYDKAITAFTDAIDLDPSDPKIYASRASAYKQKLDFEHALADLEKAMRLDPKSIEIKDSYAMAFADMGLYAVAIDKLNASLAADDSSPTTYMNLGQVYMSMGKYDDARRNLDKSLQLDPQNWDAVQNDIKLNFYTKRYAAALRDADRWLENNRESSSSQSVEYMLILKHLISQRQKTDDRPSLESETSKLRDQTAWPRPIIDFFLSKINADQLRKAAASGDAYSLKIRQCEAETYIGEMNLANGKTDDAAKNFETAVALCPVSWEEYDFSRFELKAINAR
ncbi:tetratricopeptide repeat protein [Burkholderia metallica]|uniref:tetratricopeptide repeat protein n=1 Tax=Burkholderia metallica TaxID=488729 RepID=UPI001CF3124D|nr:tetratricopeptide repeat protein [Burkholderia metallica]MCA8002279.1 tetratricopeptide repeat protein [Burkholderia metallica]